MANIEIFESKDLALALYDCISEKFHQNAIVVQSEEEYKKIFSELKAAHEDAPIVGVESLFFEDGVVQFENGSQLVFKVAGENDEEIEQNLTINPPESLDDFLSEFKVS